MRVPSKCELRQYRLTLRTMQRTWTSCCRSGCSTSRPLINPVPPATSTLFPPWYPGSSTSWAGGGSCAADSSSFPQVNKLNNKALRLRVDKREPAKVAPSVESPPTNDAHHILTTICEIPHLSDQVARSNNQSVTAGDNVGTLENYHVGISREPLTLASFVPAQRIMRRPIDFVIEVVHLSRPTAFHQNDAIASASVFKTRESGLT